jgi:NAD-dependent deacetylase
MFGEAAPEYVHLNKLYDEADMVVVIGTSGQVIDTAYMARRIKESVLNNLDIDTVHDRGFKHKFYLPATEAVDDICALIEEFLE